MSSAMPAAIQVSARTTNKISVHREVGTEIIGFVGIADKPKKVLIQIAPQLLEGTRLQALGAIYQKYRFKSLKFRMAPGIATNVSGMYTAGFSTDPDWSPREINELFAVPGAQTNTVWSPMNITCDVTHSRQPWYETSLGDAFDTIQGTFAMMSSTAVNLNGEVVVPVMMDYAVEFQDTKLPRSTRPKYEIGNGAVLVVSSEADAMAGLRLVSPGSASIVPDSPLPVGGEIYHLAPPISIFGEVKDEKVLATYMRWNYSGTTWRWLFYTDYQNAALNSAIPIAWPHNISETISGNFFIYPVF